MGDIIKTIAATPVPTILIIAGIVFLLLSVAGKIGGKISVEAKKQKLAGIIGGIMLSLGLAVYISEGVIDYQPKIENNNPKIVTDLTKATPESGLPGKNPEAAQQKPTSSYGYYKDNNFVLTSIPVTSDNKLNVYKLPVLEKGFSFDLSELNEYDKLIFNGRTSNTSPILDALLFTNALDTPVSLAVIECDKEPFKPVNLGKGSFRSKMSSANYHYKEYQRTHSLYNCSQAVKYRTLALCTFPDEKDPRNIVASSLLKTEFKQCQEIIRQQLL